MYIDCVCIIARKVQFENRNLKNGSFFRCILSEHFDKMWKKAVSYFRMDSKNRRFLVCYDIEKQMKKR